MGGRAPGGPCEGAPSLTLLLPLPPPSPSPHQGLKMDGVVRREEVAVLSAGTLVDPEMTAAKPDPSYVMAGGCGQGV